jgi:hypothetical protein
MPKPPPPPRAVESKSTLREASRVAREARKQWTEMRSIYRCNRTPTTMDVGYATRRMWAAENDLADRAATWRNILDERKSLPVAERWDLAALERWAVALDKAGAP